jgi:carboxyl-terminal processing protease
MTTGDLPRGLLPWILLLLSTLTPQRVPNPVWSAEPSSASADGDQEQPAKMSDKEQEEYYELLRLFVDTLDQVERNYAQQVDRRELMEAAIQGLLSKLDDYSQYIPPEELDEFQKSVTSQFGGIGIQIGLDRAGRLMVISPLVGTPAYRAGVMAGDRIVEIDGQTTKGMSLTEAVKRLKGAAGTEVTLTIVHRGKPETEEVELRREVVRIETVLGHHRNDDDSWQFLCDAERKIGYVRIAAFSGQTASDLRQTLRQLQHQGLQGLILDLRFNPGGLLSSAVAVSDLFLKQGLIVSTEGRNVRRQTWQATDAGTFDGFPMAVLVNRYSASASEIVAACLQDHERAVIVGDRTFGKGSVQQVVDMEAGRSALKLTTGSYHRPNGKNIHRDEEASDSDDWGVQPNSEMAIRLTDRELGQLFQHLQSRDLVRPHPAEDDPEDRPEDEQEASSDETEPFVDRQLEKALEHLRQQISTGDEGTEQKADQKSARVRCQSVTFA